MSPRWITLCFALMAVLFLPACASKQQTTLQEPMFSQASEAPLSTSGFGTTATSLTLSSGKDLAPMMDAGSHACPLKGLQGQVFELVIVANASEAREECANLVRSGPEAAEEIWRMLQGLPPTPKN